MTIGTLPLGSLRRESKILEVSVVFSEYLLKSFCLIILVSLTLVACSTLRLAPPGGTLLGETFLDSIDQTGRVAVKKYEGTVKAFRIMANGNEIEMERIVISFDGGEKQKVEGKLHLLVGALSRRVNLDDGKPPITAIEFTYRPLGSWVSGRADLLVYGFK